MVPIWQSLTKVRAQWAAGNNPSNSRVWLNKRSTVIKHQMFYNPRDNTLLSYLENWRNNRARLHRATVKLGLTSLQFIFSSTTGSESCFH